jgi:archaellum biogenesis protein FlaJ (TadC family)
MDPAAVNSWGWFALALVNAGLAEQKNRSRLNWFLVSIFLGPIATLLIVVWKPAPARPDDEAPQPISLSTGVLALGVTLAAAAIIVVALLASSEWSTVAWIVAAALMAGALSCLVTFIVRRPTDRARSVAATPATPASTPEEAARPHDVEVRHDRASS